MKFKELNNGDIFIWSQIKNPGKIFILQKISNNSFCIMPKINNIYHLLHIELENETICLNNYKQYFENNNWEINNNILSIIMEEK